ncbi:hypothetical protein FSP39_022703 [Pinctada imbricata]|uniref:Uncharacterized protein n=1 Tax=Pinctada imbricata TaxID=66713 RepID=A0AA88Y0K2_PINIB|nr:hypothetical protein FSP39_022703 [Pinctada imbricata]
MRYGFKTGGPSGERRKKLDHKVIHTLLTEGTLVQWVCRSDLGRSSLHIQIIQKSSSRPTTTNYNKETVGLLAPPVPSVCPPHPMVSPEFYNLAIRGMMYPNIYKIPANPSSMSYQNLLAELTTKNKMTLTDCAPAYEDSMKGAHEASPLVSLRNKVQEHELQYGAEEHPLESPQCS